MRNHAFIMQPTGEWQISPAYDLTPTPQLEEHSMSVNGKWSDIEEQDLLTMGNAFDVRNAAEIIDQIRSEKENQ